MLVTGVGIRETWPQLQHLRATRCPRRRRCLPPPQQGFGWGDGWSGELPLSSSDVFRCGWLWVSWSERSGWGCAAAMGGDEGVKGGSQVLMLGFLSSLIYVRNIGPWAGYPAWWMEIASHTLTFSEFVNKKIHHGLTDFL